MTTYDSPACPTCLIRLADGACACVRGRRMTAAVFVVTLLASLAYLSMLGDARYAGLYEEPQIAAHLARGHGFLTPLDDSPDAIPTSWCAPVYPWLMSLAYRAWGIESETALNAMLAFNALAHAATAAAICRLGVMVFVPGAGLVSGLLLGLHPIFLLRTNCYWETTLALAIFAWLVVLAIHVRRCGASWRGVALLGAGLGIQSLTNASYALAYPLIVLLATGIRPIRRSAGLSAAALGAFLAVIAPWTVRNYLVFDRIFYIRGGANMEMWLGNQPMMHGWYEATSHPRVDAEQRRQMLEMGENAYFELCGRRLREDYQRDPAAFWWRSYNRLFYLLVGDPKESGAVKNHWTVRGYAVDKILINAPLFVLAAAGAWTARRLRYRAGWMLPMALLAGAPYVMTFVNYRYMLPTRMMLIVLAGFLVAAVAHRLRWKTWPQQMTAREPFAAPRVQLRAA